jgi:predicted TIM-barrel fold metal-dependent hydrolase
MRRQFIPLIILTGLLAWNLSLEYRLTKPFQPPAGLHVAERDTLDNAFSRGYGFFMRPYCNFWSDSHVHAAFDELPQQERNNEFRLLADCMSELAIVNSAVYCKTEEDLAFVDSLGTFAPVWYVWYNNPDVEKLLYYHKKYNLKAVKLHNSHLFWAEAAGDSIEFPLGSGSRKKVSIQWIISPEWMRFYKACEQLGLPITWHTNNRYGPSPYNFGGDNNRLWTRVSYDNHYVFGLIENILEACPRLKIMLCHQAFMGYNKLAEKLEKHPNLFTDTSAGFLLHDGDYITDAERRLIRPFFIRFADRILFGSDANAFWEQPAEITESAIRRHIYDHVHPFKRFIQQLYLPQDVLSKVAHANFEQFYSMPPAEDWFY